MLYNFITLNLPIKIYILLLNSNNYFLIIVLITIIKNIKKNSKSKKSKGQKEDLKKYTCDDYYRRKIRTPEVRSYDAYKIRITSIIGSIRTLQSDQ